MSTKIGEDHVQAAGEGEELAHAITSTDLSLCDIVVNVREWLFTITPILAFTAALATTFVWLFGGGQEGIFNVARNVAAKIVVGTFIIIIFDVIFVFL